MNLSADELISDKSICMFDKNSILIEPDSNGFFTVISKEYRINNYVYTLIIEDKKLIVEMGLEAVLGIGDKCKVRPISGKEYLILPEKIKATF